jgi:uncharacterized membrane protein YecN with MAPEG domain
VGRLSRDTAGLSRGVFSGLRARRAQTREWSGAGAVSGLEEEIDSDGNCENFNFFHCEILFTSENLLACNACVIHVCTSKICVAAVVRVASVANINVRVTPKPGTMRTIAINRI